MKNKNLFKKLLESLTVMLLLSSVSLAVTNLFTSYSAYLLGDQFSFSDEVIFYRDKESIDLLKSNIEEGLTSAVPGSKTINSIKVLIGDEEKTIKFFTKGDI